MVVERNKKELCLQLKSCQKLKAIIMRLGPCAMFHNTILFKLKKYFKLDFILITALKSKFNIKPEPPAFS